MLATYPKRVFMRIQDQIRQNIRKVREERGLTQAQVAEKLEMSETGYAKWERGECQLRVERLYQVAKVLDINVEELLVSENENVVVVNNVNDTASNANHFNFSSENKVLEGNIEHLNYVIRSKNELLDARERENESLKQQITVLNKVIEQLEAQIKNIK